jgi:aspartate/methionine/tyrosine aminotransferase
MSLSRSDYMYWAKNQAPVRYGLSSSEVPHFRLDRFPIAIADLEIDGASRYRYPPLRAAIARKMGVEPERVVMADGASMANMLALSALIAAGDEVLIEQPVYEPITAAALHCGARVRHFSRTEPDFRIDPDAVAAALTPATKLIVLTNLHNPSSNRTGPEVLRAVAELAERHGARILVDEIFLDAAVPALETAARLSDSFVCTGSLTKVYGLSGLRCGWIIAAPQLAEGMWRLNELFGVSQAHATEQLALLALERLDEVAAGNAERLERNRAMFNDLVASSDRLECAPLTGGITAFPRLIDGDVDALNTLLRTRYDTGIVPGRFFGSPDRFRVGLGGAADEVAAGLERLALALA